METDIETNSRMRNGNASANRGEKTPSSSMIRFCGYIYCKKEINGRSNKKYCNRICQFRQRDEREKIKRKQLTKEQHEDLLKKERKWMQDYRVRHGLKVGHERTKIWNCVDCGIDIHSLHGNCIRCPSCQVKAIDRHNQNRLEKLQMKRKNLGTSMNTLGPKMLRNKDGSPNFNRELRNVSKEMQRVFKYGGTSPLWK